MPEIVWRDVTKSSNVLRVGWDSDDNMYVEFKGGGTYKYVGVSRQRAVTCAHAKSVGHYINRYIKPTFQAVKIA